MDVDIDGPRLAGIVVAPDALEKLVTSERLARMAEQECQELDRLRLDRDRLAVAEQAVTGEVDLDPTEIDDGGQRRVGRGDLRSERRNRARIRADSSRRLNGFVT